MIMGDDDYLDRDCVELFYDHQERIDARDNKVINFASRIFWENNTRDPGIYRGPEIQNAADAFYDVYFGNSRSSLLEYIFSKKAYKQKQIERYTALSVLDVFGNVLI